MKKYRCQVCGYMYDPEEGDPSQDIPPSTAFDDIPSGWACPICNAPKDDFEAFEG